MAYKDERLESRIKDLAAKFLEENSNGQSLLTVTSVRLGERGRNATVLFTVFPDQFEASALEFTKRQRSDFREYIRQNSRLQYLPFVDFAIDQGEKNRQRIEELGKKA